MKTNSLKVLASLLVVALFCGLLVGRDRWNDYADAQEHFQPLSPEAGKQLAARLDSLLQQRADHLTTLIRSEEATVARFTQDATHYAADADMAVLASRKQEQAQSAGMLLASYKRQQGALAILREEVHNQDIGLELRQLSNNRTVLLIQDFSKTVRNPTAGLPSFENDELIGKLIIEGIAPAVFDPKVNPMFPVKDIVLLGMPNIVMPESREKRRALAYAYRYPLSRAKLIVDWDEKASDKEVERLLRPTIWHF